MLTRTRWPFFETAGLPAAWRAVSASVFSSESRASKAASVALAGAMTARPLVASTSAFSLSGKGPFQAAPTIIGTPRERASMATWLFGLPSDSTIAPPRLQSSDRKTEGGRSWAKRMLPGGGESFVSSPVMQARTR